VVFEAQASAPAGGVFFPLHVPVSADGGQTQVSGVSSGGSSM
jgi:hypothetical protein